MSKILKNTLLAAALVAAPLFVANAAETPKPNILVILTDDLGYSDIGVHGGKEIPTPNIDRLAASGVRCSNAYVSAPYCSPSRAGLLTGRYQTRFGHEFNPHDGDEATLGLPLDQKTLADRLREEGYATALVGKWHLGFSPAHHPQQRGFDEFFGFLVGMHNFLLEKDGETKTNTIYARNMIYRGKELQELDGYATDLFTDEAIDFISRHEEKPWFLYLSYNAVHTPLEMLPQHNARLPNSKRRSYLSLLLGLDDNVGRVIDHLENTGQAENTLVFFVNDNGGAGVKLARNLAENDPLRGDKGQVLEGGIRVPFFVSWPGKLPAGKVYDEPVIALDISPTCMAVAGGETDRGSDGINLLPYLMGENPNPPHMALCWRFGPQKAIRKGNWKLVDWRSFDGNSQSGWQLYDLSNDIGESKDVAAAHPELVSELAREWERWNTNNIAPLWPGSGFEDPGGLANRRTWRCKKGE
jgi:arylsulfatase A-like enzyme